MANKSYFSILCLGSLSLTIWVHYCSQEIPPTPGQPVKEPMFIPVAVGLLDSTGKDIPLSTIYHDGTLQSVSSDGQPVYNIVLRLTKVVWNLTDIYILHICFKLIFPSSTQLHLSVRVMQCQHL